MTAVTEERLLGRGEGRRVIGDVVSGFVLVHGPWQAGWIWRKVAPLLEGMGHGVPCLGL